MAEAPPTPQSYEEASERLDEIIVRLDSGQAGLGETLELCEQGKELVEYCAAQLEAVGKGLEELRLDELVERLEAAPAAAEAEADRGSEPPSEG